MKALSSCYLSSLHEYSDEKALRPFLTDSSLAIRQEEEAARVRAWLASQAKG